MNTMKCTQPQRFAFSVLLGLFLSFGLFTPAVAQSPSSNESAALEEMETAQTGYALPDEEKANLTKAQWRAFAKQTRTALASDNEGLKTGALRNIIWYGPQLSVKAALPDVMSIYRNHENPNVRRMAVVALGRMGSRFAIGYLEQMEDFEEHPSIRKTIQDVIRASRTGQWERPAAPPPKLAREDRR